VIHRVKTFTKEDCNKILKEIYNLEKLWVNRSQERRYSFENKMKITRAPFWTLGAVSYLDSVASPARYKKHRDYLNPVLCKRFNWIYEIIRQRLEDDLGEPVVIDQFLARPGFHIFSPKSGDIITEEYRNLIEKKIGSIHVDIQYEEHYEYWSKFDEVDYKNPMSITIPIALPTHGGGLYTWTEEVEYGFDYLTNEEKSSQIKSSAIKNPYVEGEMVYFIGHLLHQMMEGTNIQPTDRRITAQCHALKCDGTWRVYW